MALAIGCDKGLKVSILTNVALHTMLFEYPEGVYWSPLDNSYLSFHFGHIRPS